MAESKKTKRVSMRGMGADAFFAPPVEKQEEAEVQKDTTMPVEQNTSVEVQRNTSPLAPSLQEQITDTAIGETPLAIGSTQQGRSPLVQSEPNVEVQKYSDVEVKPQRGTPLKRDTSVILDQETGNVKYIKVSYYIQPDQDMKLEEIRLSRRRRGVKVDKSELVREAIDKLTE